MDLEKIGINEGKCESPCECGIEPPGSMSHEVN